MCSRMRSCITQDKSCQPDLLLVHLCFNSMLCYVCRVMHTGSLTDSLIHSLTRSQGKANFFERRVGEYQKAGVMSNRNGERMTFEQFVFTTDEDF